MEEGLGASSWIRDILIIKTILEASMPTEDNRTLFPLAMRLASKVVPSSRRLAPEGKLLEVGSVLVIKSILRRMGWDMICRMLTA